jgi:hypothetical protein
MYVCMCVYNIYINRVISAKNLSDVCSNTTLQRDLANIFRYLFPTCTSLHLPSSRLCIHMYTHKHKDTLSHMYMYMYIYMFVCMYICICRCIFICTIPLYTYVYAIYKMYKLNTEYTSEFSQKKSCRAPSKNSKPSKRNTERKPVSNERKK